MENDPPNSAAGEKFIYSGDYADKPIMHIFQRLIANDNKENTVLTNSQITAILENEFNLNVAHLHELEVDIYLTVMKKFLKDWPQWDEFDIVVNRLKSQGDVDGIKTLLNKQYNSLKNYLHIMLNAAIPMAKESVKNVEEAMAMKKSSESDSVILDVQCTRAQLNKLIFNRPHPYRNNTVFNASEEGPSRIIVSTPSIPSMLNWWGIHIHISFDCLSLRRVNEFQFKHLLVNRNPEVQMGAVNEELQVYNSSRSKIQMKDLVYANFQSLLNNIIPSDYRNMVSIIFKEIKRDLQYGDNSIRVPGCYRRNLNKYPYERYLSTDVDTKAKTGGPDYDLKLHETVAPMNTYNITKLEPYTAATLATNQLNMNYGNHIVIKCRPCQKEFSGLNIYIFVQHFKDYHQHEPKWTCTNCKKTFTMLYLSSRRWHHEC